MELVQLEIFSSIARTMNFTRTAEQFYITQPAVSHHIKMLENSLGVKLITRSKHGVTLTEEGKEFLPYVKQMFEMLSAAENRIKNMAQGRWGHIRIAALSFTTNQLNDCLVQLYRQYPSIQVDVDLLEGNDMIDALQKGNYDFYFSVENMVTESKEYEYVVIYKDRLELFVNKAIADTIDMEDWSTIERQPFVSVPKSDVRLINMIRVICKNRGIKPNVINYYNRAESVVLSVNAGIGIALLPGELGRLYPRQNLVTFPVEGDDAELISAFAWKTGEKTTACSLFRDIVLSLYNADRRYSKVYN
jgi:DNA-binding transcriptional LysR family regulator